MAQLVFGIHAVNAILESQPETVSTLYLQDNFRKNKKLLAMSELAERKKCSLEIHPRHFLDKLCDGANHQGVVARLTEADKKLSENQLFDYLDTVTEKRFILILDQIQDPHNLGACLRTAAAAGVHVVIAPKDGAAPITPVVRKTACGATERVPYVQVTNLARTMKKLQEHGIWITGTDVNTDAVPYDIDYNDDIAIVIGSEGKGLRRLVKEHCDYLVKIPMPGQFESLNASVAAGIMLFEVVRQRTSR